LEAEFLATSGTILAALEGRLAGRGGQFFVGNQLTWADLMVFMVAAHMEQERGPAALDKVPLIQNLVARVGDIPNIKKWMANRPVTAI
jgi:glutathione S-transferase